MLNLFGKPVPILQPFLTYQGNDLTPYNIFTNTFTMNSILIQGCKTKKEALNRATKYYNRFSKDNINDFISGNLQITLDKEDQLDNSPSEIQTINEPKKIKRNV